MAIDYLEVFLKKLKNINRPEMKGKKVKYENSNIRLFRSSLGVWN